MSRRSVTLVRAACAAAVAISACAIAVACSSTTTTIIPITGITILADTVTSGHGCGTADAEVYKYAAVAWNNYYPTPAAAINDAGTYAFGNVFDCFSDGVFGNLPGSPDGSVSYTVLVGAFDEAAYASVFDGGPTPPALSIEPLLSSATYTYTCTGTQQDNITVIAVCKTP